MRVIRKEQKEAEMQSFLNDHIARLASSGCGDGNALLLVARSCDSPVVRALAGVADLLDTAQIKLRGIVAGAHADTCTAWPAALAGRVECRVLKDPRLLDAHEQLWLDERTAWIGDAMRREPDKRDAYECFAADSAATARSVKKAFHRMWAMAQPAEQVHAPLTGTPPAALTAPGAAMSEEHAPPSASRH
ncbi:MAG: hypothetical protein AB7U49_10420 [Hyphomicrobiaceae bacterium]